MMYGHTCPWVPLLLQLNKIILSSKPFCQQMHSLLKHKMLQLTLKISLYIVPTCFGPLGPSGSIRRNFAKVTVHTAHIATAQQQF
jgi:hypothetical protein